VPDVVPVPAVPDVPAAPVPPPTLPPPHAAMVTIQNETKRSRPRFFTIRAAP
jgi:hypothetical protein